MTEEEAKQFLIFQKNHDLFNLLESQKIFDMPFGKVVLNIAFSQVQSITKEEMFYLKPTK